MKYEIGQIVSDDEAKAAVLAGCVIQHDECGIVNGTKRRYDTESKEHQRLNWDSLWEKSCPPFMNTLYKVIELPKERPALLNEEQALQAMKEGKTVVSEESGYHRRFRNGIWESSANEGKVFVRSLFQDDPSLNLRGSYRVLDQSFSAAPAQVETLKELNKERLEVESLRKQLTEARSANADLQNELKKERARPSAFDHQKIEGALAATMPEEMHPGEQVADTCVRVLEKLRTKTSKEDVSGLQRKSAKQTAEIRRLTLDLANAREAVDKLQQDVAFANDIKHRALQGRKNAEEQIRKLEAQLSLNQPTGCGVAAWHNEVGDYYRFVQLFRPCLTSTLVTTDEVLEIAKKAKAAYEEKLAFGKNPIFWWIDDPKPFEGTKTQADAEYPRDDLSKPMRAIVEQIREASDSPEFSTETEYEDLLEAALWVFDTHFPNPEND